MPCTWSLKEESGWKWQMANGKNHTPYLISTWTPPDKTPKTPPSLSSVVENLFFNPRIEHVTNQTWPHIIIHVFVKDNCAHHFYCFIMTWFTVIFLFSIFILNHVWGPSLISYMLSWFQSQLIIDIYTPINLNKIILICGHLYK